MESTTGNLLLNKKAEVVEYKADRDLPFASDRTLNEAEIAPSVSYVTGTRPPWEGQLAVKKTIHIDATEEIPLADSKAICQREAKIMLAARHIHAMHVIVTYFFALESQRSLNFYIIMDRADGRDLSGHLFPDKLKERWIGCLISVVAHIHRQGIQHRDIKPQNVLVKNGEVLLADFGTAHMSLGKTVPTTMPGWQKGRTPSYCAPEVNEEQARTRGRSADIFSMGTVILEMLLSHSYFDAEYKELEKLTRAPPDPPLRGAVKSYALTLDKVHSLLDDFKKGQREAKADWHHTVFELCRMMLDRDRDRRPLADTIESHWKSLIEGANSDANDIPLTCGKCNEGVPENTKESKLIKACKNRRLDEVENLLEVDEANPNTEGAIHQAAVVGAKDIIKFLLDRGADVNVQDYSGQTPLHYAAANGHEEVADFLLGQRQIEVKVIDLEGQTPLHCAAAKGSVAIIQKLRERNADINKPDGAGLTPLHHAAMRGHLKAVEWLLEAGADWNAMDRYNSQKPLDYAEKRGYRDVKKVLESREKQGPFGLARRFYHSVKSHTLKRQQNGKRH